MLIIGLKLQFMNSPQKSPKRQNIPQFEKEYKRDSTCCSDSQTNTKVFKALAQDSYHAPDGISFQNTSQQKRKRSAELGLMQGFEEEDEAQQTTQVEMDLFKGIMLMAKSKQVTAICGLLGAFFIHLIVGAIYRWNMITGYIGIYYSTSNQTPIGAPLVMLCAGLTMRLGFKLSNIFGSKWVIVIGILASTLSVIIGSMMNTFTMFLLFHNVIYGLSAGLLFLPPLTECHKFFPKLKLVTNSIILTGTGLGAVLFGAYNIECIEKDNETYQMNDVQLKELVEDRFTSCFLGMSLMVFLVGLAGFGMMVPMINRNQEKDREEREHSMQEKSGNYCRSQMQSFQSRVFWVVAIIIFLTSCGNYYIIVNFKNLLAAQHQKKSFLYWTLIAGALGNGLTRVVWGFLSSRVGFKVLYFAAAIMNISAFVMIMATNSEVVYIIFYTINSISLGGMMVIFPNVSLLIFGKKIGQSIYSYYWVAFSLSNLFQFIITLILTNNPTTSDDYGEVLFFFTICAIGGLVLCYRQKLQGPWKNSLNLVEFPRKNRKYST